MPEVVSHIWIVAYPVPGTPVNHWVALLQYSSGMVEVDMSVSSETSSLGTMGLLMLTKHDSTSMKNSAYQFSYAATNAPIGAIYDLLVTPDANSRVLSKYRYSPEGNGCAYWVHNFVITLEKAGMVASKTAEDVWKRMQFYYEEGCALRDVTVQGQRFGTFL